MKAFRFYPHYTLEDRQRWEDDWELIEGVPYDMSPSPKWKHQELGSIVQTELRNRLTGSTCGGRCSVLYELDWIVDGSTVVRPDVMVVCDVPREDYLRQPPALVVEILSPHTAIKDMTVKHGLYEEQGVPYYVILNPDDLSVKVFRMDEGRYKETDERDFTLTERCTIILDFEGLMTGLG